MGGNSEVTSTTIAAILRGGGFGQFLGSIFELTNANNVVVGYQVDVRAGPGNTNSIVVGIPTEAQRRMYGASYNITIGASLWYTVYEMAYQERFPNRFMGPIQLFQIGNYLQPRPDADYASRALVAIAQQYNGIQELTIANLQQNALTTQLSALVPMTVFTFSTFNAQQQPTATVLGIDPGHCYAVVGFTAAQGNNPATVVLRNPHNRPGPGGGLFPILLTDFQLLFSNLTAPA